MGASVFIGSSTESINIAEAIHVNLAKDPSINAYPITWNQGVFAAGNYIMEDLLRQLHQSIYAIFVFGADDTIYYRRKKYATVRDNVLFETGLFMGALGKDRVFFVLPKTKNYNYKVPSDFNGITYATYDPDLVEKNVSNAVTTACFTIKEKMRRIGFESLNIGKIDRFGEFSSFDPLHGTLLETTNSLTTCFIHSARWRHTLANPIKEFLSKKNSIWDAILPDVRDDQLYHSLYSHFSDRLTLYAKIIDAYNYFYDLKLLYPHRINIYLSSLYPTYSIYKYDSQAVVSLYPLSDEYMPTPTFLIDTTTQNGQFFINDLNKIKSCSFIDDNTIKAIIDDYNESNSIF